MAEDRRHPEELDEQEEFERAMRQVEPLAGRAGRVPVRRRQPGARPGAARRPPRFEIRRAGERIEGHIVGADRRKLAALAGGEMPVDLRVDLHGLRQDEARRELAATLDRCWRERRRCLLVVHGRGLSSIGPPVLKEAVPEWLTEPPAAFRVLAFASAPPRLGGTGALLVWLRRRR